MKALDLGSSTAPLIRRCTLSFLRPGAPNASRGKGRFAPLQTQSRHKETA